MSKIEDKIKQVEEYLDKLMSNIPANFGEYAKNDILKRGCERYFEMIVEAVLDISFMIINIRKFETPGDDLDAFEILKNNKVISEQLHIKLKEAKGMRNFIIHQYERINDRLVYDAIKNELKRDIEEFLKDVEK